MLAGRLGFRFLDSGAMYRALTLKALRNGVDPADEASLARLLRGTTVSLEESPAGQRVLLDGEDVSVEIRGTEVTRVVPEVAALPGVRKGILALQRSFAAAPGGVVAEGRDMGTVVFPNAAVKIFLDADPGERARRRARQTGEPVDAVLAAQTARDAHDSGRKASPLHAAADAKRLDTTGLSVEQVLERLLAAVKAKPPGAL